MAYSLLSSAILFAAEKHDQDYRDGDYGLPYATHPIEVCTLLRYVGGVTDEEVLCAAALHDILEETSVPAEELEAKFGSRATALVKELTRTEPSAKEIEGMDKEAVWQLRSGLLLKDIEGMSKDAWQVKLADRLANLRQAKITRSGKKLSRYVDQTKKILKVIPKSANVALWRAIESEL